jgi:lysophospholipase L1-like esterase
MITKMIITILILVVLTSLIWFYFRYILTNENPKFWEKQVRKIEARYSNNYPQRAVLFIGSSSIAYWKTLEKDMFPLQVLNHGIAGTKIADITYYADRLIYSFNPKAIVYYAGANDINGIKNNSKSGDEVFNLMIDFFTKVYDKFPDIPIYYISISPSKARIKVWNDVKLANQLIKTYCEKNKNLTFIDATEILLDVNGKPISDIFKFDRLHFNRKGYVLWTSAIKKVLLKN